MVQTVRYWRPTDNAYHAAAPGIAVLTDDTDWEVLDEEVGMHFPGPFPAAFQGQVHRALSYLNATPTGATLLWNIYTMGRTISIKPTGLGNNVRTANTATGLNQVAAELLLNGAPGAATQAALNASGIPLAGRTQWLRHAMNHSPRWSLEGIPGSNGGFRSYLERARQAANRWALMVDPRYLRWSDSNEGYFNEQTFGGPLGVGPDSIGITNAEVAAWLSGQPLPARLTAAQQETATVATIVALKDYAAQAAGSNAHVAWNPTETNPLNRLRPPAIGLAHELLHGYYSGIGAQPGFDDGHYSTVLFEYRCVGLGPWDEAPLSENALRKEWWSYACPHIPADDTENRKAVGKRISYM